MQHPKLRDQKRLLVREPYPLNEIPDEIIYSIGGYFVFLLYAGRNDISGDDWGNAFADAIGGTHLGSPLGIADVIREKMAWSMKTVKNADPFSASSVRIISGRCSPDYSYSITDPHDDVEKTGRAVLEIWNERVNIATEEYSPVRNCVLIRSNDLKSFCLFEEDCHRFRTADYTWEANKNGNLIGIEKSTGITRFTWQPHGSQFTIHTTVPDNARKFTLRHPDPLKKDDILEKIGFDSSWLTFTNN